MEPITTALITDLNTSLALQFSETITSVELEEKLAAHINRLIQKDFEKLVALLYRIDVNEKKLKTCLNLYADENAGKIIAGLILERLQEKINSRKKFSSGNTNFNNEEKW
jgi:hypothetical protein